MSFDSRLNSTETVQAEVSIPLEQGNVFRPTTVNSTEAAVQVSIPLEQGNVFRHFFG